MAHELRDPEPATAPAQDHHESAETLQQKVVAAKRPRTMSRWCALAIPFVAAFVVVLALALGLGLGLHMKRHHHRFTNSSSLNGTFTPLSQLVNSSQFTLDPSFVVTATPTTREYTWTVSRIYGAPMGVSKPMLAVNGISPGPVIEANTGDRIIVHVTNNLTHNATAIHWHGLYQNGTNWYDGTSGITQCGIPPGQTLTYNFTLDGNWVGTTWWHAHYSTQYTDGLYGPIVVHAPSESVPNYDHDAIITLSDSYNTFSQALLAGYLIDDSDEPANEPVPDGALINGVGQYSLCSQYPNQACDPTNVYFNFTFEANKIYRLRLINSGSFAGIRFSIDGHPLTVIEVDGTAVEPVSVSGVTLQVAQRASVLLATNQTAGTYWVRATVDTSMFTTANAGLNPNQLAVLRYSSSTSLSTLPSLPSNSSNPGPGPHGEGLPDLSDDMLVPADVQDAPDAQTTVPVSFSIQRTADQNWRAFMNSTSWTPPVLGQATMFQGIGANASDYTSTSYSDSQLVTTIDSVVPVDIIINNLDDGDHPFHLHGHKPWIVGTGEGRYTGDALNTTNPMRRDTFVVPAYNWMAIRFVADHAGYWALHCHISWHMSAGGLMQVVTLPSLLNTQTLPQDMVSQCAARAQASANSTAAA